MVKKKDATREREGILQVISLSRVAGGQLKEGRKHSAGFVKIVPFVIASLYCAYSKAPIS